MAAPSVTLKTLKNEETGIDIIVPGIIEEEAPLGGVSVLFKICILTKLNVYKSSLAKEEDVVHFTVFKAYREIEDLYNKLNKKYPKADIPQIPRSSSIDKCSTAEKVATVNQLMLTISKHTELCQSSIFTHFIGINPPKSRTIASSISSKDNFIEDVTRNVNDSDDLSNVFPKVKNAAIKSEKHINEKTPQIQHVDLFEEVKTAKETVTDSQKRTSGGLFDDFDDESLFSTKSTPKSTVTKEVEKAPTVIPKKKKVPEKNHEPVIIDDSQIIIKDRKLGEVSLFDEQDLGDYITKEEPLFLVTPESENSKKNALLFSSHSEPEETHIDLHENLDDLLNLNPLPMSPAPKEPESAKPTDIKTQQDKVPVEIAEKTNGNQPKKPVPLPRKKSLGKNDTDELSMTKPEVMPRKVFLKKPPEVPAKPASSNQDISKTTKPPPASAKPAVLPKPKPPIKGPKPTLSKDIKNLDALNANKPANISKSEDTVTTLTEDLNELDILKYIEQEQKISAAEPSLFD